MQTRDGSDFPLHGLTVLLDVGSGAQASVFSSRLRELGAKVLDGPGDRGLKPRGRRGRGKKRKRAADLSCSVTHVISSNAGYDVPSAAAQLVSPSWATTCISTRSRAKESDHRPSAASSVLKLDDSGSSSSRTHSSASAATSTSSARSNAAASAQFRGRLASILPAALRDAESGGASLVASDGMHTVIEDKYPKARVHLLCVVET